jgi:putative FmdB family regulatory protein
MPLYDYECVTCGEFREWRSMSEWESAVPCPRCLLPASCELVHSVTVDNKLVHVEGLSPPTKPIAIIPSMSASAGATRRMWPSDWAFYMRVEDRWAMAHLPLPEHASLGSRGL